MRSVTPGTSQPPSPLLPPPSQKPSEPQAPPSKAQWQSGARGLGGKKSPLDDLLRSGLERVANDYYALPPDALKNRFAAVSQRELPKQSGLDVEPLVDAGLSRADAAKAAAHLAALVDATAVGVKRRRAEQEAATKAVAQLVAQRGSGESVKKRARRLREALDPVEAALDARVEGLPDREIPGPIRLMRSRLQSVEGLADVLGGAEGEHD